MLLRTFIYVSSGGSIAQLFVSGAGDRPSLPVAYARLAASGLRTEPEEVKRSGLGLREWVGLGVLALALGIGAFFYSLNPGDSNAKPREQATPTPTQPPHPIEGESQWAVTFLENGDPERIIGQGSLPKLDLTYPGAPFLDVADDKWRLLALTTFEGAAGEYQAQITYEGEIGVVINNEPVTISPAKGKGTILLAITKEEGKPLPIRLSLADTGGPAVLKWQLIKR